MRAIIACAALGTRMRRFGMDHRPHGSDRDTGLPPLATGSQHSGSDLREGSRIRGVLAGDEQVTTPANRAATGIETVLFQNPCRNGTRERLIFQRPSRAIWVFQKDSFYDATRPLAYEPKGSMPSPVDSVTLPRSQPRKGSETARILHVTCT